MPHFDSAACFAALLGGPEHGRWLLAPADEHARSSRRYLPDTAILETRFENERGAVTVTDFMPLTEDEDKVDVVRIVKGVRGEMPMRMELILRFDYGRTVPWVRRRDYGLSAIAGPDALELHTRVELEGRDFKTLADVHGARRRNRSVHAVVSPFAPSAALRAGSNRDHGGHGDLVARMV